MMNLLENSFKAINGKLATKSTPSKQEIMDWLRSEYTYEFSDIQIFPDPQMDNVYLIRNERGGELGILYTEDTGMGSPGSTHPSWSLDEGGGGDELGEWESPEYNLYTNPSTGATVQKYNDSGWTWELPNGEYQGGYRSSDEAMQAADNNKSVLTHPTKQDDWNIQPLTWERIQPAVRQAVDDIRESWLDWGNDYNSPSDIPVDQHDSFAWEIACNLSEDAFWGYEPDDFMQILMQNLWTMTKAIRGRSIKQDDIGQAIAEQIVTENYETLLEIPFQDAVSVVVEEVVNTLNDIMISEGGTPFDRSEIEGGARELVRSQIRSIKLGKAMPAQMLAGLCRSCEAEAASHTDKQGNPSFFYACMAKDFGTFGATMDDGRKKAYCAWLTKQCTGKYPNQR